jgi:Fe-S oxidoreductase
LSPLEDTAGGDIAGMSLANLDEELTAYLNACVRCGLCAQSCHYYLSDHDPESIPGYKLKAMTRLFGGLTSLRNPAQNSPLEKLTADSVDDLVRTAFGRCTMCGRCGLHCSIGLDIWKVTYRLRAILTNSGMTPKGLDTTVLAAKETGNNMRITEEEWVDTVKWLEDDLKAEVSDDKAAIPLDKNGARVLYAVNPREPKFYPLSLYAAAKVFYAAGEDWTLSSRFFDVTNYAYFAGDDALASRFTENLLSEAARLGVQALVLSECGHGYYAARWHVPEYRPEQNPVPIQSILELVRDYIRDRRVEVDPSRNTERITLHDPCHLVRKGGIVEEQREILSRVVSDFVEMIPNRERNFCCSGGGGSLSMTAFSELRRKSGRVKAEQIRRTGAKIVATPCHNCIDQLLELDKEYKLGVRILTVTELVANALILRGEKADIEKG